MRIIKWFGSAMHRVQAVSRRTSLRLLASLIHKDDVWWVVNDSAELGVKIGGRFFFLYKYETPLEYDGRHDDGSPMKWRPIYKREFGESVYPERFRLNGERLPPTYTEGSGWQAMTLPHGPTYPAP